MTGLVGAGVVAVLLVFLTSLLADLPQSALAAVVIAAALSLMDWRVLVRYARVRRSALVLSLAATVGVIVFGVLQGHPDRHRPRGAAVLPARLVGPQRGAGPRQRARRLARRRRPSRRARTPGVVVLRWEAPLFFANARSFRDRVRPLVRERRPAWVVVQCEAITDVDVTAAAMLEQLDRELNAAGVHMAFAELRSRLQTLIRDYGLFETLDRDHFYPTLDAAIEAIESSPS